MIPYNISHLTTVPWTHHTYIMMQRINMSCIINNSIFVVCFTVGAQRRRSHGMREEIGLLEGESLYLVPSSSTLDHTYVAYIVLTSSHAL